MNKIAIVDTIIKNLPSQASILIETVMHLCLYCYYKDLPSSYRGMHNPGLKLLIKPQFWRTIYPLKLLDKLGISYSEASSASDHKWFAVGGGVTSQQMLAIKASVNIMPTRYL